ncbi:GTPase-associated system all-helical protein GASH [Bradyrhizobium sp. BEA-2-5]|uniref:GTPase-associated system all-helical protein GASH n=1 Tax=Bradyrhizobium sp. BEA-2-5 TaxID=3080015 RepID=UPI00293F59F6|nr:GTPase-associated system all-helical protein GASH [Bradyrhizobium sp. BEA-2-5]WOH80562.1 GTPase-associated system all-helical protein GASH [Bradyrhizobium sp. BEA-2-5]
MTANFDFIASYRDLDASASREVIDLRLKSFEKLLAAIKTMGHIYDLCRLAYQVEPLPTTDWFEAPIKEFDAHFVLRKDAVDAARMAALLLRKRIPGPGSYSPLAVITASYCGRRTSADDNILTREANAAFHAAVRRHRVSDGSKLAQAPELSTIAEEVEKINNGNPLTGAAAKPVFDAIIASTEEAIETLSENVRAPLDLTRSDVVRLAEEVDMLWWCIGDWHEMLGRSRTEMPAGLNMVVSGIELGAMVRQLPGPFGAHGILRRISGAEADGKSSLKAALKSLTQEDAGKLFVDIPATSKPLFPVHAAVQFVAQFGASWETEFSRVVPQIANMKMSPYELGIQAYRERALITYGGLN